MNQINLDKLLQSLPATSAQPTTGKSAELKLLAGELYTARLQMLSGHSQLQLQTPQGPLAIRLPTQLSQQLSQQFGTQMQVRLSPAAPNQLTLTLQTMPIATSSISLSPTQLPPVLSQWLSQQLPGASSAPAGALTSTVNSAATTNTVTVPMQLDLKTGQLQLTTAAPTNPVLLTLPAKDIAALNQQLQAARQQGAPAAQTNLAQPAPSAGELANRSNPLKPGNTQLPVMLIISFNQKAGAAQLALQPVNTDVRPLPLTPASQQQLLQTLVSQLAPVKHTVLADSGKINLGQLTISIPPQLAASLASAKSNMAGAAANPVTAAAPLLLQLQPPPTKNGQWQLQLQAVGHSQQLTISQQQADRAVSWQMPQQPTTTAPATAKNLQATAVTGASQPLLPPLSAESKAQAWRNLLPLLSQPLIQPNNMPNLPVPLQQLFSQIQQSLPEISKPLAPPTIATQLAALLQFQPLQVQPNPQTTGGTLALAIQLLLGHLSQKPLPPPASNPANRLSQLISQLDNTQAASALRQLASLSSPLQQSQLATVDAQSQLQQWLLQLPLQQQGQTIMPQLLLEQREADGKNAEQGQKQWQLTMKFDLQQYGNLLAVAKLQQQDLQLQFYTDHNEALRLAQKFLPLLKDRCLAQGLTVTQAECQLGKIPESLIPRHNSLLTVRV
ncbi:flagellar hook-length control protein FliK [Arsukibacterium sp.]|uniref:flagellar hook-length control protein FliK n=1 Tax=Arsukibacterium sp. TaxID=1977258 RepID=UPI00299DE088|nr:flagellar hook-length control protein FliK [Arsukibacterium sp.]MDX1538583.1 flagellar hook-length control protein FliK [Arsukibacterium sp.]